jgi:hypothetical protein
MLAVPEGSYPAEVVTVMRSTRMPVEAMETETVDPSPGA